MLTFRNASIAAFITTPISGAIQSMAAGLAGIAGASTAVVGSGLAAYTEELTKKNEKRLKQTRAKIRQLEQLEDKQGELTKQQRERLKTLEEQEKKLEDGTEMAGALAMAFQPVTKAAKETVTAFGEQFIPLIKDGIGALPPLIRSFGDTLESINFDPMVQFLRTSGSGLVDYLENTGFPLIKDFLQFGIRSGQRLLDVLGRDQYQQNMAALGTLVDRVVSGFNRLTTALSAWVETFLAEFSEIGPMLGSFTRLLLGAAAAVVEALNPAIGKLIELGGELSAWFNDLSTVGKGAIAGLAAALYVLTSPISTVGAAIAGLAALWTSNFGGIQEKTEEVVEAAVGAFEDLRAEYGDDVRAVFKDVTDFIASYALPIYEDLTAFIERRVVPTARRLARVYSQRVEKGVRTTARAFQREVVPILRGAVDVIVNRVIPAVVDLGEWFVSTFGGRILSLYEEFYETFITVVQNAIGLLGDLSDAVTDFSTTHEAEISAVQRVTQRVFDQIVPVVESAVKSIIDAVSFGLSVIRGDWDAAFSDIESIATRTWNGVADVAGSALDTVASKVRSGINRVVWFVTGVGKRDVHNAFEAVGSAIRSVFVMLFGVGGKLFTIIAGFVGRLVRYIGSGEAYSDVKAVFRSLMNGITSVVRATLGIGGEVYRIVRSLIGDIATYIGSGEAYQDIKAAFNALVGVILSAFQGLYDGLIGNSLIPQLISDIAEYLRTTAAQVLENAAEVIVDSVESVFTAISFDIDWPEPPDIVEEAFNGNLDIDWPDPPDFISDNTSGGGSSDDSSDGSSDGSYDGGDDDDGGSVGGRDPNDPSDAPSATPPGDVGDDDDDDPSYDPGDGPVGGIGNPGYGTGLATGGFVEEEGSAVLHSGERVLPDAQVDDRGRASFDPESVADGFDTSDAVRELASKLDRVIALLDELNAGDVSQKEVLRALDIAEDRRAGRDPYNQ
ncbi:hypothetical protein [Halorubrum sp. C191]|uniref:hypothetical protein n=1 Tax=Halorubrum sp. C191 TaxID=1383842 RepID=UPI001A7E0466|nr:hypothetical protein [Halorubrum sp. C191]